MNTVYKVIVRVDLLAAERCCMNDHSFLLEFSCFVLSLLMKRFPFLDWEAGRSLITCDENNHTNFYGFSSLLPRLCWDQRGCKLGTRETEHQWTTHEAVLNLSRQLTRRRLEKFLRITQRFHRERGLWLKELLLLLLFWRSNCPRIPGLFCILLTLLKTTLNKGDGVGELEVLWALSYQRGKMS